MLRRPTCSGTPCSRHQARDGARREDTGAALVHVALILLAVTGFTIVVVDYGVFWTSRRQAQNAADAASMAAALSLAYDDPLDTSDSGPASRSAHTVSGENPVWDDVAVTDVTFPACPDGTSTCVRVDVHRTADRGSALPMYFGPLLGVTAQDVRATATAQAYAANATECLKPWGVPDKWIENHPAPGPWTPDSTFDKYGPGGQPLPNPDVYIAPTERDPGTGFTLSVDYGTRMRIKPGDPENAVSASWYFPLRLSGQGAAQYMQDITECTDDVWGIGDDVPVEPGNMAGPTRIATQALIDLDPTATWNPVTQTVENSCVVNLTCPGLAQSPRVVALAVFDIGAFADGAQTGNFTIHIVNILGFFIDEMQGNDVIGYLVTQPGVLDPTKPRLNASSAFLKGVSLVR